MTEDEPRRRQWLTEPNEAIVLSTSAVRDLARAGEFAEAVGLDTGDIVLSRLSTVPFPSPDVASGDGNRPWAGFEASFAWHPLAWLPEYVKARRAIPGVTYTDDGSPVYETDDQYAARLAMELSASGLYDEVTGTWLDALAGFDLDIDTTEGLLRVQNWLSGDIDFDLDTLDLSEYFATDDPDWALSAVLTLGDTFGNAAMHCAAADLREVVRSAVDDLLDAEAKDERGSSAAEALDDMSFTLHMAAASSIYAFCELGRAESDGWRSDASYAAATKERSALMVLAESMSSRLAATEKRFTSDLAETIAFFDLSDLAVG